MKSSLPVLRVPARHDSESMGQQNDLRQTHLYFLRTLQRLRDESKQPQSTAGAAQTDFRQHARSRPPHHSRAAVISQHIHGVVDLRIRIVEMR